MAERIDVAELERRTDEISKQKGPEKQRAFWGVMLDIETFERAAATDWETYTRAEVLKARNLRVKVKGRISSPRPLREHA